MWSHLAADVDAGVDNLPSTELPRKQLSQDVDGGALYPDAFMQVDCHLPSGDIGAFIDSGTGAGVCTDSITGTAAAAPDAACGVHGLGVPAALDPPCMAPGSPRPGTSTPVAAVDVPPCHPDALPTPPASMTHLDWGALPVFPDGARGAASVGERLLECMLTDPAYPVTETVERGMGHTGRAPPPLAIPAIWPANAWAPAAAPWVCAQAAPGHLTHMHVRRGVTQSAYRMPGRIPPITQASRPASLANFNISLDSGVELPSAFESAAAATELFGEPLPAHTPFSGLPLGLSGFYDALAAGPGPSGSPGGSRRPDVDEEDAALRARISNAFATVTARFSRRLSPVGAGALEAGGGWELPDAAQMPGSARGGYEGEEDLCAAMEVDLPRGDALAHGGPFGGAG